MPLTPIDREELGKLVRKLWTGYITEHIPNPPYGWIKPWEELSPDMQEVDRVIGEGIFQHTLQRVGPPVLVFNPDPNEEELAQFISTWKRLVEP